VQVDDWPRPGEESSLARRSNFMRAMEKLLRKEKLCLLRPPTSAAGLKLNRIEQLNADVKTVDVMLAL
jgi:hypothetical protein